MRHDPKWATFNSAYINEKVQFDIQNAFLDEPSEDSLIRLFTHVSLSRDPRARRNMVPDKVWERLRSHPDITALEKKRTILRGGKHRYQGRKNAPVIRELTKKINARREQRRRNIQMQYRRHYFHNRPTWDVERQGNDEDDEVSSGPAMDLQISERAQLAKILCNQPEAPNFEAAMRLRSQVCELMVKLCEKRETPRRDRLQHRDAPQPATSQIAAAQKPFPLLMLKTQCPRCIGDDTLSRRTNVQIQSTCCDEQPF